MLDIYPCFCYIYVLPSIMECKAEQTQASERVGGGISYPHSDQAPKPS